MRKLIKYSFFGTLIAVVLGFGIFGTKAFSYAETAFDGVRSKVHKNVPIDFELRRARNLIKKIDPEIREARRDVARAEVELEGLRGNIRDLKQAVAKNEGKVKRQRVYLSNEGLASTASFSDMPPYAHVRRDLARTFDLYRNQVELLRSKKQLASRQEKVLEAARSKLHAVRSERMKVEDLVGSLEAKKRQLDAMAATARRFDIDTSALGEAKELLSEIKKRLDVTQKMIQENVYYAAEIDAPVDNGRDVEREVDQYFGKAAAPAASQKTTESTVLEDDR